MQAVPYALTKATESAPSTSSQQSVTRAPAVNAGPGPAVTMPTVGARIYSPTHTDKRESGADALGELIQQSEIARAFARQHNDSKSSSKEHT